MKIDRYKQGYVSDEWGMNSHLGLIKDSEGSICKFSDVQKLIEATQWQPIDQLKKDKQLDFICYFPNEKVKIQTGWTNGKGSTVMGGMFDYEMTSQPSHFMIVKPPTQG